MSGALALPPHWLAALQARLQRPPVAPRAPLWRGPQVVGSVEPVLVAALHAAQPAAAAVLRAARRGDEPGYEVAGPQATEAFAVLAGALRAAGLAHAWRDEQLAVRGDGGEVLGTIERGVVRVLGIATQAVHLAGWAPDGRHWLQQRALDKPTDPGRWDTLVGGMVPAADDLKAALARETWEEAGLRLEQLDGLRHAGRFRTCGPAAEVPGGYVAEVVDWYACTVPAGVAPANQDGEVLQFRLAGAHEVQRLLLDGECTLEAAGVLASAAGALGPWLA